MKKIISAAIIMLFAIPAPATTIDGVPTVFPPLTAPSYTTGTPGSVSASFLAPSYISGPLNTDSVNGVDVFGTNGRVSLTRNDGFNLFGLEIVGNAASAAGGITPGVYIADGNVEQDVISIELFPNLPVGERAKILSNGKLTFLSNQLPSSNGGYLFTHNVGAVADVTIDGKLSIGLTGTAISASYRGTVTTDIAAVAANACNADIAITVTGAVAGAECAVGMPSTTPALLQGTCFVSAADTIQLRICNGTNAASADPASATYSVRVFNP